ncbi:YicC/YloC family endoribonuclease [Thalassobaculum fulvum]|nr:YicC/YloC family endoribonuclease [Thalassobaculum fulvum]
MTGFARVDGGAEAAPEGGESPIPWTWTWEIRSVNAKGLDLRTRLPSLAEGWESRIRERAQARLARGSVTVTWTLEQADRAKVPQVVVNEPFLREILALQEKLEADGLVYPTAPSLDRLLAIRGVVEVVERVADTAVIAALEAPALADLDRALDGMVEARGREGAKLKAVLETHLDEMAELTGRAVAAAETQPAALRARMADQLALLLEASPPVSEERMVQELALLATKAEVREETDRLTAHVAACRELLSDGGAIGRKLDFLCQELNREANTLCSKAVDLELTGIGVELKTRIERFREQIQNVE